MLPVRIFAFADEASPKIDEQIAALMRNGMQGVEIRNVDGENVSGISLKKAAEVRRKLDDAGLITWSVGSPVGKIDIVRDDFQSHMDVLRHTLDVARALGAENIRLFSFYIPKGEDPAAYRDVVMERMGIMAKTCGEWGVCPCHENEKGIYGDSAARCLDLYRSVPGLAGVFDPANFIQSGQPTPEAWEMLRPYIRYLHIKDSLKDGSVVPAGSGEGHVARIIGEYLADGGAAMTLEPHLRVFEGLAELERAGNESGVGGMAWPSADAAFDAAAAALRGILDGLGKETTNAD